MKHWAGCPATTTRTDEAGVTYCADCGAREPRKRIGRDLS